jgi:hypothetical protein
MYMPGVELVVAMRSQLSMSRLAWVACAFGTAPRRFPTRLFRRMVLRRHWPSEGTGSHEPDTPHLTCERRVTGAAEDP